MQHAPEPPFFNTIGFVSSIRQSLLRRGTALQTKLHGFSHRFLTQLFAAGTAIKTVVLHPFSAGGTISERRFDPLRRGGRIVSTSWCRIIIFLSIFLFLSIFIFFRRLFADKISKKSRHRNREEHPAHCAGRCTSEKRKQSPAGLAPCCPHHGRNRTNHRASDGD